jgi:hypothetical protein
MTNGVTDFGLDHDTHWLERHRGPFRMMAVRPLKTKPHDYRSEWLPGSVDADTIEEEAESILTDPRDSVSAVYIWSEREGQFCWWMKGETK